MDSLPIVRIKLLEMFWLPSLMVKRPPSEAPDYSEAAEGGDSSSSLGGATFFNQNGQVLTDSIEFLVPSRFSLCQPSLSC